MADTENGNNGNNGAKESIDVFQKIKEMVPSDANLSKIEFEGPDIIIYLKNQKALYADDSIVRNIAATIKKKIVIRSDP